MALRVFLIVALVAGLAGCAGTPRTGYPSLLPIAQLAPPPPGRRPDPLLLARGAALALRAAELAAP